MEIVGHSAVLFETNNEVKAEKYLYVDNLFIDSKFSSILTIEGWKSGRDHFLVKKSNHSEEYLKELLGKTSFTGYGETKIREFNDEYWEFYAGVIPEPSTYGAAVALCALGLGLRPKKKQTPQSS